MNKQLLLSVDPKLRDPQQLQRLWPALKGSLAKVYKPCIRPGCPTCARGDKHPAWILSFAHHRQRRCLYVPEELVPTIRQAIHNGRQIEALLHSMAPAIVHAYRQQRDKKTPSPRKKTMTKC